MNSIIVFDSETDSLDIFAKDIVGFAFKYIDGHNYPIEWHDNFDSPEIPIEDMLQDKDIIKVFHNAKFEMHKLKNYGIEVKPPYFDTQIAAWLCDIGKIIYTPDGEPEHSYKLKDLAEEHLGYKDSIDWKDLIKERAKELKQKIGETKTSQLDQQKLAEYCMKDVEMTDKLYQLTKQLLKKENLMTVFNKIEMPLVPIYMMMERMGVQIDVPYLSQLSQELDVQLTEIQSQMELLVNEKINWSSPKQLQEILFNKLKLPVIKQTKTGASTGVKTLKKLKSKHPIVPLLLSYRNLTKLKSTYTKKWIEKVHPKDNRLHADIIATIETGRIGMKNPNPQQIPKKTENAGKIRRAFITRPGYVLIEADYSQMDLRGLAHESGDTEMVRAFNNNEDIHDATARLLDCDRSQAKAVNFGIVYGKTAWGFAADWGVPLNEADEFLTHYLNKYSGVKEWMVRQVIKCKKEGWITNLFGFKRKVLPEIFLPKQYTKGKGDINRWKRESAERKCYNYPIQGFTAYATKKAMIKLSHWINSQHEKDIDMLLQIHDAVLFECKYDESIGQKHLQYAKKIKQIMESVLQLKVPLKVNVSLGKNLYEMEEV